MSEAMTPLRRKLTDAVIEAGRRGALPQEVMADVSLTLGCLVASLSKDRGMQLKLAEAALVTIKEQMDKALN